LANYQIERLLGRGGMAEVYYGWDVKLARPVAVKVIDDRYRENPAYAERFVNEARAMAAWHHPHIIPIYYASDDDGLYYYVMEYLPGLDLGQVLGVYAARGELPPPADVLRIGRAVADALDFSHAAGIVHRDVKPSNILLAADGRVLLADFGLALNTSRATLGEVFGSPHYMAPEQARSSAEATGQSDLYALGVILYEMLTGTLPFDDPSPAALALQQVSAPPPPPRSRNPRLNRATEAVLLRALAKEPQQRYATGRELLSALESALSAADIGATQPLEGAVSAPPISAQRVTEIVAAAQATGAPAVTPRRSAVAGGAGRRSGLLWLGLGCGGLLLAGLLLGGIVWSLRGPRPTRPNATVAALVLTLTAEWGASPIPPVAGTPGPPLATTAPVEGGEPIAAEPTPAEVAEPSQPPSGGGDKFMLYYDDSSFYLKNLSPNTRRLANLSFEAITNNGRTTAAMDGTFWAEIYPLIKPDTCAVLELVGFKQHLKPETCDRKVIVLRTPTQDVDFIFWTKDKGAKEFRVLWNGQEAGRCAIGRKVCEVRLP
jgi:tRNA A-37 threonylcarbamoyl transferase component Bud32